MEGLDSQQETLPSSVHEVTTQPAREGRDRYPFKQVEIVAPKEQLRREYVALRIYRELGLITPESIISKGDQVTLATEDFHQRIVATPPSEKVSKHRDEFNSAYLASLVVGDRHFVERLAVDSSNELILLPQGRRTLQTLSGEANWYSNGHFEDIERDFRIKIENHNPNTVDFINRLNSLTPQKILGVALESGMPPEEVRSYMRRILADREKVLKEYSLTDLDESLENTPEWDKVDGEIAKNPANRNFQEASVLAGSMTDLISKIKEIEESGQPEVPLSLAQIKQVLARPIGGLTGEDLIENYQSLDRAQKSIVQQLRKMPLGLQRLMGYTAIRDRVNKALLNANEQLGNFLTASLRKIDKLIETRKSLTEEKVLIRIVTIGDFPLPPTLDQLKSLRDLNSALNLETLERKSPNFLKALSEFESIKVPDLQRIRVGFKKAWERREKALISHLTLPYLVKKILREGFLRSQQRQAEVGNEVYTNSPVGSRNQLLPQLIFSLNSAALGYGGRDKYAWEGKNEAVVERKDKRVKVFSHANTGSAGGVEVENSVGFVGAYETVLRGRRFIETPDSGGGSSEEVHVFDAEHSEKNNKGVEIPVDTLVLLVPEKQKAEWQRFLSEPISTGGAGKDNAWIEKHLT